MYYLRTLSKDTLLTKALLLWLPLSFAGCAVVSDMQQATLPPNSVILIKQEKPKNYLLMPNQDKQTALSGKAKINPERIAPPQPSQTNAFTEKKPDEAAFAENPSSQTTAELAQKTLMRYLKQVERQPESIGEAWVNAEILAQQFPNDGVVQDIWQRLMRYSDWQPVNSIISNGGIDIASFNGWQPESPAIRARRALLPTVRDNEQVIFSDQRLVLVLINQATVTLNVDVILDDIAFLPQVPAQLQYQIDDLAPHRMTLDNRQDWQHLKLTVPSGEHAVRFYQDQPVGNQFIKLRFAETGGQISLAQERPYFISTLEQPFAFYSKGPCELRIDELTDGRVVNRYQTVSEGWHTITLLPPKGKVRSLYRVSQRVVNLTPKSPNNRIVQRELVPVPSVAISPKPPMSTDMVELVDAFKLGKQQDGTLSVGLDFVRRNNKQESGRNLPEEQFMQARSNYRYYDEPHNLYFNTLGLARYREYGGPTFGLDESLYYNPEWLPFNVHGDAKVFAQAQPNRVDTLAQMNLTLSQAYDIHPKFRLIPSVTFFARTLSRDQLFLDQFIGLNPNDPNLVRQIQSRINNPNVGFHGQSEFSQLGLNSQEIADLTNLFNGTTQVAAFNSQNPGLLAKLLDKVNLRARETDQDVYTPYKSQHKAGFNAALTAQARPFLDSLFWTRVGTGTNEDFNVGHPDHYSLEQHWQQLVGEIALDASYRVTFYQPDNDRASAQTRSYAGLEANWQRWLRNQNRLELSAQYSYDIERKANLAMLSFTWHFGEGRGLRDFAPNEIDFRDIRERQFVNGRNNFMGVDGQCTPPCLAPQ